MSKKKSKTELTTGSSELISTGLVDELRDLIHETRSSIAQAVNSALVLLYWEVGTRIRSEVLKNERADYGKQIVASLASELMAEFGSGYSHPNIAKMLLLARFFLIERFC